MQSVWEENTKLPEFEKLRGNLKTDVLIIGGGMAGLLCAYMLEKENVDYALVEAETICSGITGKTTAKITSQHGLIYNKLIREFSVEEARMYLSANEAALAKYSELCADIDCDFETKDNYVYSINDSRKLDKEMDALGRIGCPAELVHDLPLPISAAGAVRFSAQAQFNPLKFVAAISKGLNIYEHTKVTELIGTSARTANGEISANTIIVATHFPFLNKHGSYFLKMYQHRSYVIALENASNVGGMYVDDDDKGMSFRNYNDFLLLGGGDHRTGKQGGGWRELESFAARNYTVAFEKYRWAAQDCMTLDGMPYIGRYSKKTHDLLVATGFNKWGMSSAMVSATILTDMLLDRENEYARLFSPSRSIMRPQLAANAFEAAVSLLTPSQKRCPHLGCALKWNAYEHTWDCPCHGSRFTEDGKLIDNPATGDLK